MKNEFIVVYRGSFIKLISSSNQASEDFMSESPNDSFKRFVKKKIPLEMKQVKS